MMSSISTLQGTTMQQVGGGQRPPPPPPAEAGQSTSGAVSGPQDGKSAEGRPPPPPEGARMGGEGAQQGGQMGGADPQAVLESLFDAIDTSVDGDEAADLLATLTAAAGYGTAQSIFG